MGGVDISEELLNSPVAQRITKNIKKITSKTILGFHYSEIKSKVLSDEIRLEDLDLFIDMIVDLLDQQRQLIPDISTVNPSTPDSSFDQTVYNIKRLQGMPAPETQTTVEEFIDRERET